jgi:predicted NAD/FAD-dependent oxidoreductase
MFHFTHEFSTKWIEAPENEIEQEMLRIIKDLDFQIKTSQLKKWRYADPLTTYGAMAYSPKTYPTLHLGGDAFGGGSVEGAWRSAMKLLSLLNL